MIRKSDLSIVSTASKDYARPVLTAIKTTYNPEDKTIELASTDGYILGKKVIKDLDYTPDFETILIPRADFEAAAKLTGTKHHVEIYTNKFVIKDKDGIVENELSIERLVDGTFPEYGHVVPELDDKQNIYIDIALLKRVLATSQGTLHIQLEKNEDGTIDKKKPMSIRSESKTGESETLTVIMPLKA